jgi:hypothetical protein
MIAKAPFLLPHPIRKPAQAFLLFFLVTSFFLSGWIPSGETAERTTAKKNTQSQTEAGKPIIVKEISFHIEAAKEDLLLTLDRFHIPEISRIEGDNPRIVLDLHPVVHFPQKDYAKIAVNGQFIKQLRSHHDRKEKKLRLVLDMNESLSYFVQPSFIKSRNLFLLEITEGAIKK